MERKEEDIARIAHKLETTKEAILALPDEEYERWLRLIPSNVIPFPTLEELGNKKHMS